MPICRLAYADFKMAYADTFIGRFAGGGLLTKKEQPTVCRLLPSWDGLPMYYNSSMYLSYISRFSCR